MDMRDYIELKHTKGKLDKITEVKKNRPLTALERQYERALLKTVGIEHYGSGEELRISVALEGFFDMFKKKKRKADEELEQLETLAEKIDKDAVSKDFDLTAEDLAKHGLPITYGIQSNQIVDFAFLLSSLKIAVEFAATTLNVKLVVTNYQHQLVSYCEKYVKNKKTPPPKQLDTEDFFKRLGSLKGVNVVENRGYEEEDAEDSEYCGQIDDDFNGKLFMFGHFSLSLFRSPFGEVGLLDQVEWEYYNEDKVSPPKIKAINGNEYHQLLSLLAHMKTELDKLNNMKHIDTGLLDRLRANGGGVICSVVYSVEEIAEAFTLTSLNLMLDYEKLLKVYGNTLK